MSIATANIPVPVSGVGAFVDISVMVGAKTVQLSGLFQGYYDVLASHDDAAFVSVASFNADGPEGVEVTVPGAFSSMCVRSNAQQVTPVLCRVSGVSGIGQNGFGTIATLAAGFSGLTPIIDTSTIVGPTGSEADTNFICRGDFQGPIVVLGSIDGVAFNPIGEFRVDRRPQGSPAVLELTPLLTETKTRYVRLLVPGATLGPVVVTMGGRLPASGSGPSSGSVSVTGLQGAQSALNDPEVIIYECPLDTTILGALITPFFYAIVDVTAASTGTFRVYVGSHTPGNTAGGAVVATITTGSLTPLPLGTSGAPVANPGVSILQITAENDTPATCVSRIENFSLRFA